jgi:ribosomal protein S12 methylthiotransferase accessory factor
MPQVRAETLSDFNYDLLSRFERACYSVTLLNITMPPGVPTILSVARGGSPEQPALIFAAASDLNPERAARKALEELAHTARYSQQIKRKMPRVVPDPDHGNIGSQADHLNFWCDEANARLADFVFSSRERVEFDELENLSTGRPEEDLATLLDMMSGAGHQVLMSDLTSPDVRELGLSVVRVIVPGLHPLFMGHRIRALGGRRLWEVPAQLGYEGISRETGDNPSPHPYP